MTNLALQVSIPAAHQGVTPLAVATHLLVLAVKAASARRVASAEVSTLTISFQPLLASRVRLAADEARGRILSSRRFSWATISRFRQA